MIKSRGMRAGRSLEVCSVSDTAWDNGNALPPSKVSLHHFDTCPENRLIGKNKWKKKKILTSVRVKTGQKMFTSLKWSPEDNIDIYGIKNVSIA